MIQPRPRRKTIYPASHGRRSSCRDVGSRCCCFEAPAISGLRAFRKSERDEEKRRCFLQITSDFVRTVIYSFASKYKCALTALPQDCDEFVGLSRSSNFQPANIFVSHFWGSSVVTFFKRLQDVAHKFESEQRKRAFFWIDFLCVPQTREGPRQMTAKIQTVMKSTNHFILVLSDPFTGSKNIEMSRLWCVYELALR